MDLGGRLNMQHKFAPPFSSLFHACVCCITIFVAYFPLNSLGLSLVSGAHIAVVIMTAVVR
jgi:hypothetical protein